MVRVATEYISVGGNRHPGAADWDVRSGLLAFGADNNVALWDPSSHRGVQALLVGHRDKVSAVRFIDINDSKDCFLITGSVDHSIRVWKVTAGTLSYTCVCELTGHTGTVNTIAVHNGSNLFASGAADGTVRVWRLICEEDKQMSAHLVQTIAMKPRFFPLTLAIKVIDTADPKKPMIMAVGGTTNNVHVFSAQDTMSASETSFVWTAKLSGHEAWVRSLAFRALDNDLILASASQDKYIRLWKVHRGEITVANPKDEDDMILGSDEPTLSNKAHTFTASGVTYSITFEALLLGHEDWIYTVSWSPAAEKAQLLSASADNSVTIWEQDPVTGVWVTTERMGELSVTKGSTSATGSTGGFWIGLWSPDGTEVVSLARTGSWRAWAYDAASDVWRQRLGISGHVRSVNDVQWEPEGAYLVSTSSDQTSRLYAEWLRDGDSSWHEFSRPQIHGYDINCIATLGPARFVSGADEKLLRVFNKPKQIAQLLESICGIAQEQEELPEAANIPVLGLSNKAVGEDVTLGDEPFGGQQAQQAEQQEGPVSLPMDQPPLEDHLARHTLWPEHEKLYGHGYEISAVTVSHDRSLIATACKASSIDHAVTRLYDTKNWREIKPSLTAHSLTITSLRFSSSDQFLLSVGRDRQWAIFQRDGKDPLAYSLFKSNPKAHSRMILGAAWAPASAQQQQAVFATAGRDKCVKLWRQMSPSEEFECISTIALKSAVTAVSFHPNIFSKGMQLAVGEESGQISVYTVPVESLQAQELLAFDPSVCPAKPITQLTWRPGQSSTSEGNNTVLAASSEDSSVRLYKVMEVV